MHNYIYAAEAQGYFKDEGIDVKIQPTTQGSQQSMALVAAGKADVAISTADTFIQARLQGAPLVAFVMGEPVNPVGFIYPVKTGIKAVKDLAGKKICTSPSGNGNDLRKGALKVNGIDPERGVEWVSINQQSLISVIATGGCDVLAGFYNTQPPALDAIGVPSTALSMADMGVDMYGIVLVTNETYLKDHAPNLKKFVNALAKGNTYAYKHVEQACKYTMAQNVTLKLDVCIGQSLLVYKPFESKSAYGTRWGSMTEAKWEATIKYLRDFGVINKTVDISKTYTNDIINTSQAAESFRALTLSHAATR